MSPCPLSFGQYWKTFVTFIDLSKELALCFINFLLFFWFPFYSFLWLPSLFSYLRLLWVYVEGCWLISNYLEIFPAIFCDSFLVSFHHREHTFHDFNSFKFVKVYFTTQNMGCLVNLSYTLIDFWILNRLSWG